MSQADITGAPPIDKAGPMDAELKGVRQSYWQVVQVWKS